MDKLAPLLFKLADAIMEDSRFSDEEVQELASIFRSLGDYLDLEENHDIH